MRHTRAFSSLIALSAALAGSPAHADPTLRKQVDQKGDFVVIGNVLAQECSDAMLPVAESLNVVCPARGDQGNNFNNRNDTAPDVFWRADWPQAGELTANASVTAAQARSTAVLALPSGATVTYARIYWAGLVADDDADEDVVIERQSPAFTQTVTADDTFTASSTDEFWYQSTADVTAVVQALGAGPYRVGGVDTIKVVNTDDEDPIAAWSMVVFYSLASEPTRNLTLFDGLDVVRRGGSADVTIQGFLVPSNAGFDAKLGVIAYEGEQQYTGDALSFNGTAITNALNPANNFFNGTRSFLGASATANGDLPRLSGEAGSLAGMDIDVVDVETLLQAGATQATIRASSTEDMYVLGAFITSISTLKPNFTSSQKTFTDVNGGLLLPGDTVEYTITAANTGNDASTLTVVRDALPTGVTYVPGSLRIVSGPPGARTLTDAAGDDVGEYETASRQVVVRIGTNAMATQGGAVPVGQSTVIAFRVTVDPTASGTILNQAIVTARGQRGAPEDNFPTDGNGNVEGAPPTPIVVEADPDGDGVATDDEIAIGTDPNDADSDDDGVQDGAEPNFDTDSDGDGLINALDPDSDDDGIFDGTELGKGCSGAGTQAGSPSCIPDADPSSTTNPVDADTDNGGVSDGAEDSNHNGRIDPGETNPNNPADDTNVEDSDGDGLSDDEEENLGSDPNDADSDDDGASDGAEANPSADTDGDGLINVLDPDSDDDGLYDGTELGLPCNGPGTNASAGHCAADGDAGATVTSPVNPDTDGGSVSDGNEDADLDGVIDTGETDPTLGHGDDDVPPTDTDGDGLSDDLEDTIGSDPNDADTDDDGAFDGEEANPADDTDGDGLINVLDPDSDDDGLFDGTELGKPCNGTGTNTAAMRCTADGDGGSTTTSPVNPDTDRGGVPDGTEDADHDGVIDPGETDPNDPSDDLVNPPGGTGGAGSGGEAGAGDAGNGNSANGGNPSGGNTTTGGRAGGAAAGGDGGSLAEAGVAGDGRGGAGDGGASAEGGVAGEGGEGPSGGGTAATGGIAPAAGRGGQGGAQGTAGSSGTAATAGNDGAAGVDGGTIEGGGCSCRVSPEKDPVKSAGHFTALLGLLGLAGWRRQRRVRVSR